MEKQFIYKPLLRPASSMLPISKHPFGLIAFDRELTDTEIETYDLERVK